MAPTSGHQHTVAGYMDPDWQTHESGGLGEQVPRGRSKLAPMHQAPNTGRGVHTAVGASLERPWALAPPNRQVHESVRIHGSRARMLVTTSRGHQTCRKKLSDVSWT